METAKTYLRQTNEDGVSIYSHLTEVLATLLSTKPENPLDQLEGVSLQCKKGHYSPASTIVPDAPPEVPPPLSAEDEASAAFHAANAALLAPKASEEDAGDQGTVSDVQAERALFECAGVGLSKEESYRVHVSLLQLQQAKNLSFVRFFGKLLGTGADYYVAQATYVEPPAPEEGAEEAPAPPGAPVEESGTGCNTFVYFVTNDPSAPWTALADVTPEQIVKSRLIRN
jgi:radial spoke head protein 4A